MGRRYRVGEVAALTGVSVRTLHHYDRIGLLRPSARSEGGHRLYTERDLLRLQQVLTLRYLGFPLGHIGALLDRPDFDLVASMRIQRGVLRERMAELERIDAALDALLRRRLATGRWDWALAARATAAVQDGLAQRGAQVDRMSERYTPEQTQQFEQLRARVPPEEIGEVERGWTDLLAEVRANRHLDPASPQARALADRWAALTARTRAGFRGNQELLGAIQANYQRGAFEGFEGAPQAEDFAFIARVNEARTPD